VLLALVKEAVCWPREAARADLTAFVIGDPRQSLEEMKTTEEPKVSTARGKWMVFVSEVRGEPPVPPYGQDTITSLSFGEKSSGATSFSGGDEKKFLGDAR
jgi:hypothetical protein